MGAEISRDLGLLEVPNTMVTVIRFPLALAPAARPYAKAKRSASSART